MQISLAKYSLMLFFVVLFVATSNATYAKNISSDLSNFSSYKLNPSDSNIIKISGTITTSVNIPLFNAQVNFNNKVYHTDSNGQYLIEIPVNDIQSGLIVFSKTGFECITRNYNTCMNSKVYNELLIDSNAMQTAQNNYPNLFCGLHLEKVIFKFSPSNFKLDSFQYFSLNSIGRTMRANPSWPIYVQGYYTKDKSRCLKRYKQIIHYLNAECHIDNERIIIEPPIQLLVNGVGQDVIIIDDHNISP
jgi:hypothetical protein